MMSLSDDRRTDIVNAFDTASRYLDGILNINNVSFGGVVGQMCPSGLQLGGVDASGTKAAFLDLHLSKLGLDLFFTGAFRALGSVVA